VTTVPEKEPGEAREYHTGPSPRNGFQQCTSGETSASALAQIAYFIHT
jgi:hypothetical protein